MEKETRYGLISDVHGDPRRVPVAIEILKKWGIEKLIVNGDIGDRQESIKRTQEYSASILESIGKSGIESYIGPGSHETLWGYGPVIDYFAERYDNIIDTQRISHVNQNGHQLIFLPGSDYTCGGEYQIGKEIPSGRYIKTLRGWVQFEEISQYFDAINKKIALGAMQYANMNDIKGLVKDPEKAIIICHVPRKFNNLETCVDMSEFGEAREEFMLDGMKIEKGAIFPYKNALGLEKRYPVEIKKENRGNEDLKNLYEELGIKKAINGHFHDSGHRANDRKGNPVEEGKFVIELFWNSGCLDYGQAGILTVKGDKLKYQNIRLNEF